MFGDEHRRRINLGGASSTVNHDSVIARVQAERSRRAQEKKEQESASLIQAHYRAYRSSQSVKQEWNRRFDDEPTGTVASTRYLVLGGCERTRLVAWTKAALDAGNEAIFSPFGGTEALSWIVLLRQLSVSMLTHVRQAPLSEDSVVFLKFINLLVVSRKAYPQVSPTILQYLLTRDLYSTLSNVLRKIPVGSKSSPALPGLITLSLASFKSFPSSSPFYIRALSETLIYILTIPLLPNRIPIASLSAFSSTVPFSSLNLIDPEAITRSIPKDIDALHLLANLLTFVPPRYPSTQVHPMSLNASSLATYITLLNHVLARLPVGSLEPAKKGKSSTAMDWTPTGDIDSDDDQPIPKHTAAASSTQHLEPSVHPTDAKTAAKLETLVSQTHITSLLTAANKSDPCWKPFIELILSISFKWPKKREEILTTIVGWNGGIVLKRLWRDSVRSSPLGKENQADLMRNTALKDHWPPLLLLTDLYIQALLTMGDDEFFSTGTKVANTIASRNPFSTGEVILFSRQLLNIVWPLYWNDITTNVQVHGLSISWEFLRDRLTKCLQAIHARDSRRPFTPQGHWLMTSQMDLDSFIDAAITEEKQLEEEEETGGVGQVKRLTARELAYLSPRQGVLNHIPFTLPFETRVNIFRSYIRNDQFNHDDQIARSEAFRRKIKIRRDHVSQDGFDHLNELGPAWKGRLAITFIDQWGQEEAGIDGGGVFKEFFTALGREVFDTNRGLWLATGQQELYPNPHSYAREPHQLNWYRFIGRVLGKALYEGILVDASFAGFFLAKWLKKQSFLDDLASLDPELYQGLIFLKNYAGNPEDLSLDFSITEDDLGITRTIDLIPNGSNTPVTKANRHLYIQLVSYYRLTAQIKKQSNAFFEGLSEIIEPRWLRMFNQQELKILVGGAEEPIDLDDLRDNVVYGGLFDENHPTINMFWRVLKSLDQEKRRLLLRFVTSCARPPLLGFKELRPKFAIRDAGIDASRLPTASTCVNLLKLPLYQDEETLRRKLLHAINSNAGFDLS